MQMYLKFNTAHINKLIDEEQLLYMFCTYYRYCNSLIVLINVPTYIILRNVNE